MLKKLFRDFTEKGKFVVPVHKAVAKEFGGYDSIDQIDRLVFDSKEDFIQYCRHNPVPEGGYYDMPCATSGDFSGMDLSGVDWRRINLGLGNLNNAVLDGADLSGATLDACTLDQQDFANVKMEGTRMWGLSQTMSEQAQINAHKAGANFDYSGPARAYDAHQKQEEASLRKTGILKRIHAQRKR